MHLSEAVNEYKDWLATTRELSPHTFRAYAGDLELFVRHQGPASQVSSVDESGVRSFVLEMKASGLATATVRRRLVVVRSWSRWLLDRDYLNVDPFTRLTFDLPPIRRLPRALATPEVSTLLRSVDARSIVADRLNQAHSKAGLSRHVTLVAVAVLLGTGLRVSELTAVTVDDVTTGHGAIRVLGKGRRERFVYVVDPWLTALLDEYIEVREALPLPHRMLLFNGAGDPLLPTALRARLASAAEAAGIVRRVTPHMLRHTAATQLIELGVDIRFVQASPPPSSTHTSPIERFALRLLRRACLRAHSADRRVLAWVVEAPVRVGWRCGVNRVG
jgi:site-specific recombinase XerD